MFSKTNGMGRWGSKLILLFLAFVTEEGKVPSEMSVVLACTCNFLDIFRLTGRGVTSTLKTV